jgi:prephenate dehydrogenase
MGLFGKGKITAFRPFARKNIGVVGLGVVGGSIAKALVRNDRAANVIGVDTDAATVDAALRDRCIAFGGTEPAILRGCSVIFVAVPIQLTARVIRDVYAAVGNDSVITDAAGIKQGIIAELPDGIRYVGGHPMAGSEKNGFANSRGEIMEGCKYILTRTLLTTDEDFAAVKSTVNIFTPNVIEMSARGHDEAVAALSHVPHVVAYSLASACDAETQRACSAGFKDMTRIACSEPSLWVNTCRLNRAAVLGELSAFEERLARARQLIESKDWDALNGFFTEARERRMLLSNEDDVFINQ